VATEVANGARHRLSVHSVLEPASFPRGWRRLARGRSDDKYRGYARYANRVVLPRLVAFRLTNLVQGRLERVQCKLLNIRL
jgi:hypothetical protein